MANNVKESNNPSRAADAFRRKKELDIFKDNVQRALTNIVNHYDKRLEELENDFNEKIAHLQKKFFDNSNHNVEVFAPTEEFIDDKDYTSIIEDILSIEEIIWKDKNCFNLILTLKGSSRIYKVFIVERKNLPTEGSKVTFKYNLEHNKLNNFRII